MLIFILWNDFKKMKTFSNVFVFRIARTKTYILTKYQFEHSIEEIQTLNKTQNWPLFQLDNSLIHV